MGGLAGIVDFRGSPSTEVLRAMSAKQAHRGPAGEGEFSEGPVALAHRRRSVAPTRSQQPLVTDDLVVLMDGWIYDHAAVARRAGHAANEHTDTEVLAHAFRAWGTSLVRHLDGAFAAAIWDRKQQRLHLMRDRMGTRPLFWARTQGRFAFASELPALLEAPWVSRELDRHHIAEYLSFRVVHAPRTLIRDVRQLEPAHWLVLDQDKLETRRYWSLKYAPEGTRRPKDTEAIAQLQEAMDRSVKRRLQDGVPAALYLSGGLGSTAIAASARTLHKELPSFTLGFKDDPHPELPFAGRVAALLGLEHHEVIVGSADLASAFDRLIPALGHPVGNPGALLQLLLAERVGEHAKVVLTGDGSVELFGGRFLDSVARDLRVAKRLALLPGPLRRAASMVPGGGRSRSLNASPERYGIELGLGGSHLFTPDERTALLADPDLVRPEVRQDVLEPFYSDLDTDPLNAVLHATLRSWLCEDALTRADRTGSRAGLDTRFPLLDRDVLTLAASLPGSFKVRRVGGSVHTRWPLRAMLKGTLPPPLVNRPKRWMPAPMDGWLRGPGRLFLEERVRRLRENRQGLFKLEAIDSLKAGLARGDGSGLKLWGLILLDAWLDEVGV